MIYETALRTALEAAPDFALDDPAITQPTDHESVIFVDTPDELKMLIDELHIFLGTPAIQADGSEEVARHEGQHASAWKALGCLSTRFGLRLFNYSSQTSSATFCPSCKLGIPQVLG